MYLQWIKRELERTGKSQAALAPAMGLDPVKLSKSLGGTRKFRIEELHAAAAFFGVGLPAPNSPLISSYDPDAPQHDETSLNERGEGIDVRHIWGPDAIPELVAEGGLGSGHVVKTVDAGEMKTVDQVKDDYWRFPGEFTRSVLGAAPIHMVAIECSGDSMEPTLSSGDRVWVNTLHRRPTPDGLYAIRDVFDAIVVKRLEVAQERPLRLRIISDNPMHNPREVSHDDIRIIGKVVAGLKLF